ncbi:hypothetical protein ABFP36_26050, partial [Salmonella enterica subsp. enterica serovar Kentucky]
MRSVVRGIFLAVLCLAGSARGALALSVDLSARARPAARVAGPAVAPQPLREGVRRGGAGGEGVQD